MKYKALTILSLSFLVSACSSPEGLEMPNSPCACSYEGKQPTQPSGDELEVLTDELFS